MEMRKWGVFISIVFIVSALFSPDVFADGNTRDYLTTGNWYPRSPDRLNALLDHFFNGAETKDVPGKIKGIIGPHAGISYSGQCAANAYKQLQYPAFRGNIQRVFLLGVSHSKGFYGAAVSTFDFNSTPLGKIPVDTAVTQKLAKEKHFRVDNIALQREHSLENHLPFLQKALGKKKFKIVPILFGFLEKKDFKPMADIIKKYIDENTLVVASTDLTHYGTPFGYAPFKKDLKANLTKLDMGIVKPITGFDFDTYYAYKKKTGITMCGFIPVGVMMNIFADKTHTGSLVDYYKSGDMNNDYSHSVSYASIIISKDNGGKKMGGKKNMNPSSGLSGGLNKKEQMELMRIARDTLVHYLEKEDYPEDLEKKYAVSDNLKAVTGVFVTLKKKGNLRGCIGSIIGREPLYIGVRDNAVNAAVKDYRFPNVKKTELKNIHIEISVMTPLQPLDDYKKIRLGTDGVIIKRGRFQAVYLPQVATETGWNLDQFLGHLCQKAGLPSNSYTEAGMDIYIFQAQVFGEHEM